ncbi:endonuclease/exonuclease/phosphatase family protein [Altibacter sp. HG106]|uniref:endonuclease/exonuclease/phosphatase family protein n=1 Tax=Altibacter sp. HG106 TaxID=3023937 RepID=UPI00235075B7|nr:endonuclease/exonuclease/phosphatase family protein [Altibacter sp. HG106]MDC7995545.1 endonuclease/exonuclease/phosphatase family protein [Altibacter sp. HG106]
MKKLGFFNTIVFGVNGIFALLLLLASCAQYLPPKQFAALSLLSLAVSPLVLINIAFFGYWLLRKRRHAWLSFLMLSATFFLSKTALRLSAPEATTTSEASLGILSFNVRLFNAYEESPKEDPKKVIASLLETYHPDVVLLQEFYREHQVSFSAYPFRYIHFKEKNILGHAIFSKYPLHHTGAFNFSNTYNNSLYADVVKGQDTIRLYNLHLQSMGVMPSVEYIQEGNTERMLRRMTVNFKKQQAQIEQILSHAETSPYPTILAGDFNNTRHSYIYRQVAERYTDAFKEKGSGLGTTFSFDSYPLRIDYIFTSSDFEVTGFKNITETFSDHNPIYAQLSCCRSK